MATDKKSKKMSHLVELRGSDFEIADGEPDIKGWNVFDLGGQQIGEVDDVLFDPGSLKVRYLIVDLDDNELGTDRDKKILIPIGVAQLQTTKEYENFDIKDQSAYNDTGSTATRRNDEEYVLVHATAGQLDALPPYEKDNLTPQAESTTRYIFEGSQPSAATSEYNREDFYNHDHFNENRFYSNRSADTRGKLPIIEEQLNIGKREVETGGARIRSRIVNKPVEEDIRLRKEHVNIQRTAIDRPINTNDGNAFKEEEIHITEYSEVPVVTKEARIVEEVSINKEIEERDQTIRETLRNTEVEAERIKPPKGERR